MKVPILFLYSVFALPIAQAEILDDTDREALLDNLEKLQTTLESRADAKFKLAIDAFRTAIASDEAAKELYLNCTEKVNFLDQQKKAADFREWKRSEDDNISEPGLTLALRYQLRWLMLTLQAASENADRAKLTVDAQSIVDTIFQSAEKLAHHEKILNQSVVGSVFAKAYDIEEVKVENWSMSPIQLDRVYTEILLPPHQNPSKTSQLRATWIKRIQQEGIKAEFWHPQPKNPKNEKNEKKEDKKIGMAADMKPPEYERFLVDILPKLQWEMEVDLFNNGDQRGAAVRMMSHLEKYALHIAARKWAEDLQKLLTPKPATPLVAPPTP